MTNLDPLSELCWKKDGPIPPVDPADLKIVWAMQEERKKDFDKRKPGQAPNETFCISINYYKRLCSPGANVGAVWYRLSILEMLRRISEITGTSLPWAREGKPGDAVFKALATVPMTGLPPGVVRKVAPFDPDELIRLIKDLGAQQKLPRSASEKCPRPGTRFRNQFEICSALSRKKDNADPSEWIQVSD